MLFARILCCCALVTTTALAAPAVTKPAAPIAPGVTTPSPVMTQPRVAEPTMPSTCIDQMLTEPDYDAQEPQPISDTVDGGCMASHEPIST